VTVAGLLVNDALAPVGRPVSPDGELATRVTVQGFELPPMVTDTAPNGTAAADPTGVVALELATAIAEGCESVNATVAVSPAAPVATTS
jgi:hypothetical protein